MDSRKRDLSRRRFLQLSGHAGLLVGLSSCVMIDRRLWGSSTQLDKEVVILGGGLSGMSAALNLKQRHVPYIVYEAQDRAGGRVFSMRNPLRPQEWVEMGGEFIDGHHETFRKLCGDLLFNLEKSQTLSFSGFDQQELVRLSQRDFGELDRISFAELLAEGGSLSKAAVNLLRQQTYWRWGVSPEEISALPVCFHFNFFKKPVERFVFQESMQSFLNTFYQRISGTSFGGNFLGGYEVVEIKESGRGFEILFLRQNKETRIYCERVICTLPLTALSRVRGVDQLRLSERKKYWIKKAKYSAHTRLFLPQELVKKKPDFGEGQDESLVFKKDKTGYRVESSKQKGAALKKIFLDRETLIKNEGDLLEIEWLQRKYQWGKVVYQAPGEFLDFIYAFSEPEYDQKFLFAGEHTSLEFSGTMNGAVESGILAAQRMS